MQVDDNATGDQVNLLINQPDLPRDDEARENILNDLEMAVEEVLDDHDVDPLMINAIGGHTYSSIEADCPQCGGPLKLIEPRLDPTNGANATASCDCGWYGDAIYRLIDLHEKEPLNSEYDKEDHDDLSEDLLYDGSSVRRHNIRPQYCPY